MSTLTPINLNTCFVPPTVRAECRQAANERFPHSETLREIYYRGALAIKVESLLLTHWTADEEEHSEVGAGGLTYPNHQPIAIWVEADCDGPTTNYIDCEHPSQHKLPYGEPRPTGGYMGREEFELILADYDKWTRDYWKEEGYLSGTHSTLKADSEEAVA